MMTSGTQQLVKDVKLSQTCKNGASLGKKKKEKCHRSLGTLQKEPMSVRWDEWKHDPEEAVWL